MSLALFATIVIELERRSAERVAVCELAEYAAVSEHAVLCVLADMHSQGHCVLFFGLPGQVVGAQWMERPACA
jgi:hypothetical protein